MNGKNHNHKEENKDVEAKEALSEETLCADAACSQGPSVDELAAKEKERAELHDKYLRLGAEFDNARKRWDRDRDELFKFGNFAILKELLPIVDTMESALKAAVVHANHDEVIKGLEMTHNNLLNVLKKNGLEVIEAKGKKFDPNFHEVVFSKPDEGEEHIVLEEAQKGYMYNGKLLRASKVIISVKTN
jgi:molecular chaperone GrpE